MAKLNEIDEDLLYTSSKDVEKTEQENSIQYKKNSRKKRSWIKIAGAAAACIILAAGIITGIYLNRDAPASSGGTDGKINITSEIKVSGTPYNLSNEEAYSYLEERKSGIISELKASGVDFDDLTISKQGYSHIRTGDKGNELPVDWKDFLAWDENQIVAILSVHKDSDGIHDYAAFGGPWFPEYSRFLKDHTGQELVFILVGDVEAIITPDNTVVTPLSADISESLEEGKNYYHFFKRPENTFIPE